MELSLVLLARQEWFQVAQIRILNGLRDNPGSLSEDDINLLSSMVADSAKDVERLTPAITDTLAGMTIARRDAIIARLKYGDIPKSKENLFNRDIFAYANEYDRGLLRMAPLFSLQLFPSNDLQDFINTCARKHDEHLNKYNYSLAFPPKESFTPKSEQRDSQRNTQQITQ